MRSSEQALLRTLRAVPIFRSLTSAQIRRLEEIVIEVDFKPGARIIRQGDAGDTFYILKAGEVKVTRVGDGSSDERDVAKLGVGDFFGEVTPAPT